MNADLERLIALQQHDLEGKRLREELADAPKRVAAAEAALAKAQSAVAAAEAALKKEEVLRHGQEVDVLDRRAKIARLQKQMESATSATQITALEHEIKFAQEAIRRLEDEEIASMERTEQQEAVAFSWCGDGDGCNGGSGGGERTRGKRAGEKHGCGEGG